MHFPKSSKLTRSISLKPRTSSYTTRRMWGTRMKMRSGRRQRSIIRICAPEFCGTDFGSQQRNTRLTQNPNIRKSTHPNKTDPKQKIPCRFLVKATNLFEVVTAQMKRSRMPPRSRTTACGVKKRPSAMIFRLISMLMQMTKAYSAICIDQSKTIAVEIKYQ